MTLICGCLFVKLNELNIKANLCLIRKCVMWRRLQHLVFLFSQLIVISWMAIAISPESL